MAPGHLPLRAVQQHGVFTCLVPLLFPHRSDRRVGTAIRAWFAAIRLTTITILLENLVRATRYGPRTVTVAALFAVPSLVDRKESSQGHVKLPRAYRKLHYLPSCLPYLRFLWRESF